MRVLLILCALMSGCAAKHRQSTSMAPGVHKYSNCHEVSIDAKNDTVTVICPRTQKP
jgi:hypothetical protein